jgi:hypothetical protein
MKRASAFCFGLLLALSHSPIVRAAPPAIAQTEVNYLLGFIGRSGCQFYRNGKWYDSKRAEAHLRAKYDALAASNHIATAVDFIEQAATRSDLSGETYAIKCNSGPIVATNVWLGNVLTRYRSSGE